MASAVHSYQSEALTHSRLNQGQPTIPQQDIIQLPKLLQSPFTTACGGRLEPVAPKRLLHCDWQWPWPKTLLSSDQMFNIVAVSECDREARASPSRPACRSPCVLHVASVWPKETNLSTPKISRGADSWLLWPPYTTATRAHKRLPGMHTLLNHMGPCQPPAQRQPHCIDHWCIWCHRRPVNTRQTAVAAFQHRSCHRRQARAGAAHQV